MSDHCIVWKLIWIWNEWLQDDNKNWIMTYFYITTKTKILGFFSFSLFIVIATWILKWIKFGITYKYMIFACTCVRPWVKINWIWIKNCLAFFRQKSEKKNQLYSLNQICLADLKKSFIWPIEVKKRIHFAPWFENHVVH